MKKAIMTILIALVAIACGTKSTGEQVVDSTAVVVDTTAVSGNGEVPADTIK